MGKRHQITREEVFVRKLTDMLSDLRLDLDMLALYFGRYASNLTYRRLEAFFEASQYQRQTHDEREEHYEYIINI